MGGEGGEGRAGEWRRGGEDGMGGKKKRELKNKRKGGFQRKNMLEKVKLPMANLKQTKRRREEVGSNRENSGQKIGR